MVIQYLGREIQFLAKNCKKYTGALITRYSDLLLCLLIKVQPCDLLDIFSTHMTPRNFVPLRFVH